MEHFASAVHKQITIQHEKINIYVCHPKWEQNHPKLCGNRVVVHENDNK